MPQKRGETQEQFMDRLRAVRGLPPMRQAPSIMDRTRAAVAYIGTAHSDAQRSRLALFAFMDIFHPEVSEAQVREMARAPIISGRETHA